MVCHLGVGPVLRDSSLQSSGDTQTTQDVESEVVFFCSQLRVEVAEHMPVVVHLLDLYLVVPVLVVVLVQQLLLL